jgi:serine/threonine protein kinase
MNDPLASERQTPPTPSRGPAATPHAPAGYEIECEVGSGGMGVVYRARDVALDRLVALKFVQGGHPAALARFAHEARVTARLQHPGIPPVYEVGELSDGRPFLAMKLIRGRTLASLLREQGPGAARWLGVFESICQAVGYAHSHGVIHRDLKPSNVMVGPSARSRSWTGDWRRSSRTALLPSSRAALPRAEGDPSATTADPVLAPTPGGEPTHAGTVLGTPAFMPPEQAIGAVDKLGRASDVFGLGAVLCALLTGEPPFAAAEVEEARQMAARAKLGDTFARLDGCGAEPDLIALAKRCLAAEQAERPADAGVLAALGLNLLHQQKWAAAEEVIRASLAVREKKAPEHWATFNTRSMLGAALLGQNKYDEAEPQLLEGYRGMRKREKAIPPQGRDRIPEALDRLVTLYVRTKRPDEAKKYRAERANYPELLPPPLEEK